MSRTKSVLGNFSWSLISSLSLFIYGFVISAIIARVLGEHDYGDYTYLVWMYTVVSLVAALGSGQTITKHVSEWVTQAKPGRAAALVRRYVGVQTILVGGLIIGLWLLLQHNQWLIGKPVSSTHLLLALVIALPVTLNATFIVTLQGLQRFRQVGVVSAVNVAVALGLIAILLQFNPRITTFLSIVLIAQLAALGLYGYYLRDFLWLRGQIEASVWRPLLVFAAGIYAISFIDMVVWQRSEIYFLGRFAPQREIGFYNLAFGLVNASIYLVVSAFNSVLVPVFTRLHIEDKDAIHTGFYRTTKLAGLFVLPAAVGLAVMAPSVVSMLYGEAFLPVAELVWILAISVSVSAIAGSAAALVYSQGKHWFNVKTGIPLALGNIGLDLWLIPHYWAVGAAWANTITQVVGVSVLVWFVLHTFALRAPFESLAKCLVAALAMGGVLWGVYLAGVHDILFVVLGVPLGMTVYMAVLLPLRVLDSTDILMLRSVEEGMHGRARHIVGRGIGVLQRFAQT